MRVGIIIAGVVALGIAVVIAVGINKAANDARVEREQENRRAVDGLRRMKEMERAAEMETAEIKRRTDQEAALIMERARQR